MRNLKKILALVLALVMSFSVMTVSSAAFKDEDKISGNYAEAVEVLNYIGVFRGDENGKFNPQKSITRAEVAAIIYRITTGDVTDDQAGFYADLNMFTDVKANDWFAGYVNYCASAEYIKGRGDGSFDPNGKITGYDALTMILRAIGRDKDGEFTGEGYTVKVAQIAKQCGITDTLKGVALGSPASREVIAEILLNTITVPQFSYTLAWGYSIYANPMQQDGTAETNETLGYENFGLWYSGDLRHDSWGVPYVLGWFIDANVDDTSAATLKATYKVCDAVEEIYGYVITSAELAPVYESFVGAYECDVAKEMGLTKTLNISAVTVNGTDDTVAKVNFDGNINPLSTKVPFGAQGRWTRIFKVGNAYEVVMMDQFLAQVTNVTEMGYDRNGHVKYPATVTLNIYGQDQYGMLVTTVDTWSSKDANFENVVGETILMYHHADLYGTAITNSFFEIVGAPDTLTGYQTALTNKNSHVVEDVEYADAIQFNLDQAGYETNAAHTWFFDTHGNLIAAMDVRVEDNTQYGVITAIKWVDEFNTLSAGYALAAITFMDGTSTTMKVNYINYVPLQGIEGKGYSGVDLDDDGTISAAEAQYDYLNGLVSSTTQYNTEFTLHTLYAIKTTNRGVELIPTTQVANAYTTTGVSQLGKTAWYADHETLFLVQTYDAYGRVVFETYTGINEIPSYAKGNPYWVVDLDSGNKNVAEYVYIINPSLYGYDDETVTTFFSYVGDKLTVYKSLYADNIYLYTVYGGLVNGEEGSFSTFDPAIVQYVEDNQGILLQLDYTIEFPSEFTHVVAASRIIDVEAVNVPEYKQYTIYGGSAAVAFIENGVLFTIVDGVKNAYNLGDAVIVDEYNRSLESVLAAAKMTGVAHEDAYLYVTYTKSGSTKAALTVYVTTREGYTNSELTADVTAAMEKVEEIEAELAAAEAELATRTAALADLTDAELVALIEELKEELETALAELDAAIKNAAPEAVIDEEEVAEVVEKAETTIETATETVVGATAPETITVADVSLTYAVDADVEALVIAAVKAEVEKIADIAALIEMGAVVAVETEFVFADAAETNAVEFVVTVTYGDTEVEYEVVVNVTAKVEAPAAE